MSRKHNHHPRTTAVDWADSAPASAELPRRGRHRHHDPIESGNGFTPDESDRPRGRGRRGSRPSGPRDRGIGRAGRGQLRASVLLLLDEKPRHGYDLIAELGDRSDGAWNPSPGAIYPMLRRLAAKGLVEADETEDGRRSFSLTDEGRTFVEEHRQEWGQPWLDTDGGRRQQGRELKVTGRKLAMAVTQVASVGTDDQIRRTEEILDRTRKEIYALLAE